MAAAHFAVANVAKAIADFEPVTILVNPHQAAIAQELCAHPAIQFKKVAIDDSWIRDSGPTFVYESDRGVAGISWRFDAYGGKYPHEHDRQLSARICDFAGLPSVAIPLTLEGGAIAVDGSGTVLSTKTAVLDATRNPGLAQADIEALFGQYLGATNVIWLNGGLADDDTNGHIDEVAMFVRAGVVLALVREERSDADYEQLAENLDTLRCARDSSGNPLQVIPIAAPAVEIHRGRRLSMSYTNCYIANDAVLVPGFNDPVRDFAAVTALRRAFPDRKVLQLQTRDISIGGGNIHCITQQQPAALNPVTRGTG